MLFDYTRPRDRNGAAARKDIDERVRALLPARPKDGARRVVDRLRTTEQITLDISKPLVILRSGCPDEPLGSGRQLSRVAVMPPPAKLQGGHHGHFLA